MEDGARLAWGGFSGVNLKMSQKKSAPIYTGTL